MKDKPGSLKMVLIIQYNVGPEMLSAYSLLALLDHLDRLRYGAVVVFNRSCDAERAVAQRGIDTFIFQHGGGHMLRRIWEYGKLPLMLWNLARRVRPSIIHADNVMAGRPAVVLSLLTGLPVIVHLRNIGLFRRTSSFIFRADHFAAMSKATVEGTLPSVLQSRATVVWDGLELADYHIDDPMLKAKARNMLGLPQDKFIIGMIARLSEQKGQRYYVEAAKNLTAVRSDVLFVHAGKSPRPDSTDAYERELAKASRDMCASGCFRWFDYIDETKVLWAAVDIAVLPACGPEAFGRVVIEAMAMERPVIATMVGGPEEIIESGSSGLLIPPGDSQALTESIDELLNDGAKAKRIGKSGRQRVEGLFSAELYAERIMAMYDHLLAKKNFTSRA